MPSQSPSELRATGVIFWNGAAYVLVDQNGGFASIATTAPGVCVLTLVPGNFVSVLSGLVQVQGSTTLVPGALLAFGAVIDDVAGDPTGTITVTTLQEQAVGGSILAGASFRIAVSEVIAA